MSSHAQGAPSALSPVPFHGQTLFTFIHGDDVFVAMKPMVEAMGLAWGSQRNRIKRDPILSKGVFMMNTPSDGGPQKNLFLPLKMLNGWLFGIDVRRVKPELQGRILTYQMECFDALWRHFHPESAAQAGVARRQLPAAEARPEPVSRMLLTLRGGQVSSTRTLAADEQVLDVAGFLDLADRAGYLVIPMAPDSLEGLAHFIDTTLPVEWIPQVIALCVERLRRPS